MTLVILIIVILGWSLYPILRNGTPVYYAARRCLRMAQPPGERRFWVRMVSTHALVAQTADATGVTRRVSVVLFDASLDAFEHLLHTPGVVKWRENKRAAIRVVVENAAVDVDLEYVDGIGLRVTAARPGVERVV